MSALLILVPLLHRTTHGVLERAQHRSLQSANRHMRDIVASRNIGLRLARSKALESFLALVGS